MAKQVPNHLPNQVLLILAHIGPTNVCAINVKKLNSSVTFTKQIVVVKMTNHIFEGSLFFVKLNTTCIYYI